MIEINSKIKSKIPEKLIRETVEKFFQVYKIKNKTVSVAFIGDKKMRDLNREYRKKDKTTDVLSFSGEDDFFGEILICYQQIKRQAKEYKKTAKQELIFILVHGLLHLIGMTDETENGRIKMIETGDKFISRIK